MKLYKDEGCSQCGRGLLVQRVFDLEGATLADVLDAIESEHESTFGKREDNRRQEGNDGMETAKGITGVASDGVTVWMGGVLASQYEENLLKRAADVLSVILPDIDDDNDITTTTTTTTTTTAEDILDKTIYVNCAKLPSPVRVGLIFSKKKKI